MGKEHPKIYRIDRTAIWTVVGIAFLFSLAIAITLMAPRHVDPSWTQPTSPYQVQMYEIRDPHVYVSSASSDGRTLEYVDHLKKNFSLLAFVETETVRITAPPDLDQFVTRRGEKTLKLTSRLLLLREYEGERESASPPDHEQEQEFRLAYTMYELYDPEKDEAFALSHHEGILADWVDQDFVLLDESVQHPFHRSLGVIYTKNPVEFRYAMTRFGTKEAWRYSPDGQTVSSVADLQKPPLFFHSQKELIAEGEHLFAIEGCWYCHTDQTRTLVQDLVLNGSPEYPAPPSSPNEYIFQQITFPGTRRIGPDLSRVAIKRPARDWHMSHFWSPRSESPGSIMPSFQHFFDKDPRGVMMTVPGIPNFRFEAIFQYLMTKGSRITPPTQAWWEGKDPVNTLAIIQGGSDD